MKKLLLLLAAPLLAQSIILADDNPQTDEKILNLYFDTRLDWQGNWIDGETLDGNTGFAGKYLNIHLDGNITSSLSYSWRQRLNKPHKDASFFDATDWVYLNYNLDKWNFAGGKQVVAIGGWEYDRAPIDLYGCSVFWNNAPCYQIGASVAYNIVPTDKITIQFCQSPFHTADNKNMYAYNIMWNGNHEWYEAIWSANFMEIFPGKYINYLSLGNKFSLGKLSLELDLMNRASSHQTFLFKDMSLIGELSFRPTGKWNLFGKFTYDVNHSGTDYDTTVLDGTELSMAGAGIEFYPFINSRHILSFHAAAFYSWGKNTNQADIMQNKTFFASVGVKWTMNLLSIKR